MTLPLQIFTEGDKIFLTQTRYQEEKQEKDNYDALEFAIDLREMLDEGGPYLVAAEPASKPRLKENDVTNAVDVPKDAEKVNDEKGNRFKKITQLDVAKNQQKFVSKNTTKANSWTINLFEEWKQSIIRDDADRTELKTSLIEHNLFSMSEKQLNYILSYFILSLKKENGKDYKNVSIYNIVCGIQKHLRLGGRKINFFLDDTFEDLRNVVDNVMIETTKTGTSIEKKTAGVISLKQEEFLWENVFFLGTHNPLTLSRTLFWVLGVNFGLRGGEEHRNLSFNNFRIDADNTGATFLSYTERISKTYMGVLKHKHLFPRNARAYENLDQPERCPVLIYKTYLEKLPKVLPENAFYLRPVSRLVEGKPWVLASVIGHNELKSVVKDIMSEAGFSGYYTNNSLRATTATRLFNAGAPEQVIREQTGHRPNAINAYKRTSDDQKAQVSNMIQGNIDRNESVESKCLKIEPIDMPSH